MGSPEETEPSCSRRAVLRAAGAAGLATTAATAAGAPAATVTPTVMTQNAYLGVDLTRLAGAESLSEGRAILGDFLEGLEPALYEARAEQFAAAVAAADPAVLALQEAVTVHRQQPGDFGSVLSKAASETVVDFYERIRTALADRGLDYTVAAETVTNEIELPADTDDGQVDVRLTDRDVLLVRDDVDTAGATTGTYDATLTVPVPRSNFELIVHRGYCTVEATVDGVAVTVANTHLESSSAQIRRQQAAELLELLPSTGPVILGGDFNSAPGEAAYGLLTERLTDAYSEVRPDADGATCCQADDLRNDEPQLTRRIDGLLYRGAVTPTAVERVGHRTDDRVAVEVGGETVRVWPSDHAGVVGTFEVTGPRATPTTAATPSTGTPSTASADSTVTSGAGPGLGVVTGVVGVLLGAAARRRRGE